METVITTTTDDMFRLTVKELLTYSKTRIYSAYKMVLRSSRETFDQHCKKHLTPPPDHEKKSKTPPPIMHALKNILKSNLLHTK